ncbi:MAG TPA: AI-2E family transporter [Lacipirellulaceae bacterium]|nr:AI-2E family transporter [Lacipirellulaceae bacterium]
MTKQRGSSPLFILVAIIAVVAALYLAKEILLPLALSILLSFLLTPLANRLERWRVPRVLAVILVVAASFIPLGIVGWIVTDQLVALSDALPRYRLSIVENVAAKVRSIRPSSKTLNTVSKTVEDLGKKLADGDPVDADDVANAASQKPDNASSQEEAAAGKESDATADTDVNSAVPVEVINRPSLLDQVGNWLSQLAAPLTTAGLVVVLVFFLLLDRESQRNRLIQLFGRSNLRLTTEAFHDAAGRVGRYLRMLFLINLSYGIAVAVGLWLIGVPSAIMWGVLGFTLRFLPYIGPWISALGPILVSVAVTEGWTQPLLVMGMYVVYELLLNNVAEPLLYGSSVGVSSVGVILSAIFWTWLWGPFGLVLAMPMTVCLLVAAHYIPQLRFLNVILADQPPLTPPERIYQRLLAFDYNEPLKVARAHLKSSTLTSFYDDVLIPALVLSEQDRHAGLLNEDQEEFVQEGAGDLVAELRDAATIVDESDAEASTIRALSSDGQLTTDTAKARVLCIPLRDEADETVVQMLSQLLAAEGFAVETEAAASLTSELVDRVATTESDLVVISILPPISPRDSRLLWKRLRGRYPDLPIIVGFWNSTGAKQSLLPPDNDTVTKVATTLAEAVTLVRNAAVQLKLADTDLSQEARTAS